MGIATGKPTPTPSPTPDVGALFGAAVGTKFNALKRDFDALGKAKWSTPEASGAARQLSDDYKAFLDTLDTIPFPPSAKDDLSALKKTAVALQVFWAGVAIDSNTYSSIYYNHLNDANNQAELLLGHDVGVSLVISSFASPTP